MTPYYEDREAGITLYCGDCFDVLPSLTSGSVDLVLVDPPYGKEWRSGFRRVSFDFLRGDDGSFDTLEMLSLCLSALKIHRHLYCFGLQSWGTLPIAGSTELIWDKEIVGSGDLTLPWGPQHERILFGVYYPSKANRQAGDGRLAARLRRGSILRSIRPNSMRVRHHPTEKPVDILQQMIESSTMLGECVLDPCAGIGSTLVAARMEGRRAIGIEIEEAFCEIAANRLRQRVLPLSALEV
jgi:site-specific DNA-methyltransferase (adenine-specific)